MARGLRICALGGPAVALACGGQGGSGFPSSSGSPDDSGLGAARDAGLPLEGSLSATYDGTAKPPVLSGQLNLGSQQLQGTGAVGPWMATLQ